MKDKAEFIMYLTFNTERPAPIPVTKEKLDSWITTRTMVPFSSGKDRDGEPDDNLRQSIKSATPFDARMQAILVDLGSMKVLCSSMQSQWQTCLTALDAAVSALPP